MAEKKRINSDEVMVKRILGEATKKMVKKAKETTTIQKDMRYEAAEQKELKKEMKVTVEPKPMVEKKATDPMFDKILEYRRLLDSKLEDNDVIEETIKNMNDDDMPEGYAKLLGRMPVATAGAYYPLFMDVCDAFEKSVADLYVESRIEVSIFGGRLLTTSSEYSDLMAKGVVPVEYDDIIIPKMLDYFSEDTREVLVKQCTALYPKVAGNAFENLPLVKKLFKEKFEKDKKLKAMDYIVKAVLSVWKDKDERCRTKLMSAKDQKERVTLYKDMWAEIIRAG